MPAMIRINFLKKCLILTLTVCCWCIFMARGSNRSNARYLVDSIPATDSLQQAHLIQKKVNTAIIINAGVYAGSMSLLYKTWYSQYPQGQLHSFNDGAEWLQMDKVGHVYSAYTMGRFGIEIWKTTGIDKRKAIWIGGLSGAAYQTVIEVLDGYSAQWGWSWGDFAANCAGSGLLIAQELGWGNQRLQLKTSFHKRVYDDPELNKRSDALFGKSMAERALKDYNGQIYWLSANVSDFFPHSSWPSWLNVSVGMGADGLFGARKNKAYDANGNLIFDRTGIARRRVWYLGPDVDFTKIKTRKKWVKGLLIVANSLKFPAPALSYSSGKWGINWIGF